MSLLQHDSQFWPVALTLNRGEASLAQHLDSLASWDAWFARGEPFHVIRVYLDAESLKHPTGAGPATQRWMQEGAAEQMRNWVQSMLIVVPPESYERMTKMSVRKAFGISGGLFPSLEAAYAWLANPAEPVSGLPIAAPLLQALQQQVAATT